MNRKDEDEFGLSGADPRELKVDSGVRFGPGVQVPTTPPTPLISVLSSSHLRIASSGLAPPPTPLVPALSQSAGMTFSALPRSHLVVSGAPDSGTVMFGGNPFPPPPRPGNYLTLEQIEALARGDLQGAFDKSADNVTRNNNVTFGLPDDSDE